LTKISTIYDGWITLIDAELSGYTRIANPYDPEQNANLILEKGYGVGFGPGSNTGRFVGKLASIERDFNIVLVNKILALDGDQDNRAAIEKSLFEDQFKLTKALEINPTLAEASIKTFYISDGGIEFLKTENTKSKYYLLESVYSSEYLEDLT